MFKSCMEVSGYDAQGDIYITVIIEQRMCVI